MTAGLNAETERVRSIFDRLAPRYDRVVWVAEKLLFADGRRWVCSQVQGEVLEIAVGTGRNFAYYPSGVRLTGIDVSYAMLEIARRRAQSLGRPVTLQPGDAQHLPFPDAAFDTVVFTLALCSIPDDGAAVAVRGMGRKDGRRATVRPVSGRLRREAPQSDATRCRLLSASGNDASPAEAAAGANVEIS